METEEIKLQELTNKLMKDLSDYGLQETTLEEYKILCNKIVRFADDHGITSYSPEFISTYKNYLDNRLANGEICKDYHRLNERAIRMLSSLAETGITDFSARKPINPKYPVPATVVTMIEDILNGLPVSDKTKSDLRGPMRHLFWYGLKSEKSILDFDDDLIMKFLINEVPVSNGGSTGRTLRCVKYVTSYLKANGNKKIRYDYNQLVLKNKHRKIVSAFTEDEIRLLADAADTETPLGKRDLAIILLAYCTGLRGVDILKLKLSEIDWRKQRVSIVQSKTHTPIISELNGAVMNALADYVLNARPSCDVPEVFVTSKAPYRNLSYGLSNMIDKYCTKASITKLPLRSFHSLRRSFETVMVSHGVPIETVSQMMGHKTIDEDKPYITHDKNKIDFVAMDFSAVPIKAGLYAVDTLHSSDSKNPEGGEC